MSADLVLLHGRIWTGEPASPPGAKARPAKFAEAVAIANGRFLAVGADTEIADANRRATPRSSI